MANPNRSDALTADRNGRAMLYLAQTLLADASVAHSFNGTFSNTELQNACNALGTKINAILDILEAHGLMKDA